MLEYNIQTKMSKEEFEKVKNIAQQQGRTISNFVRMTLLKEVVENG